jgi:hypothetical protein
LVISAEAMLEMPAAARKTVAVSALRGNFMMCSFLDHRLDRPVCDLYGSKGRKVSSALKCLQAGIAAAAEPPAQSIMPIAA